LGVKDCEFYKCEGEISERPRKALKCTQSNELSAGMGTFNMRWEKAWKEASVIAIMHLLAVYTESLNKLDPLPSFKHDGLNLF
jgi:hypothetical protein